MKKLLLRRYTRKSIQLSIFSVMTIIPWAANSQCDTASVTFSIDNPISCFGDTTGVISFTQNVAMPLIITEIDRNSPDFIEVQNVSASTFDATGYYVVVSSDYTNINIANQTVWNLSGMLPPGWIDYRDDAAGANYWGNNIFWNSGSASWAVICDPSNNVVDAVFWGHTAAAIATFAPIVNGNTLTLSPSQWIGDGWSGGCGTGSMTRSTNIENNDLTDWTCNIGSTAGVTNITLIPSSNSSISSYAWNTGATTNPISGLGAGTYVLSFVDSLGCPGMDSITLVEPPMLLGTSMLTGILCFGDSTGTATTVTSGGTGPIVIDWGTANPTMLPGGYTSYTLTDSLGCSVMDSVLINEPTILSGVISGGTVPCFGDTTGGVLNLTASGGTPSYTYLWNTGDMTSSISGLGLGSYSVTVTDTNGCTIMVSTMVTAPTQLTVSGTTTDETIGADGAIDITVAGGTSPYTYSWTNGAGSVEDPSGLITGSYTVTVTDSNGCTIMGTYIVGSQVGVDELSLIHLNVNPNPNNGTFDISVDGVSGGYELVILNSLGKVVFSDDLNANGIHTIRTNSLMSGVYFVRINSDLGKIVERIVINK